jgi:hypothetical protein
MSFWGEDSRLQYAIAAILGMIAGVAAKQAVMMTSGQVPRPISLFADVLILGMIWIIAMYAHQRVPSLSLEAIALFSAALAMWGPKGINKLLVKFQQGALRAADTLVDTYLPQVDPVHRPTNIGALDEEAKMRDLDSEGYGAQAPIRKLRDVVPLLPDIPADMARDLGEMDKAENAANAADKANKGDSHE